jgi:hypothetical protein
MLLHRFFTAGGVDTVAIHNTQLFKQAFRALDVGNADLEINCRHLSVIFKPYWNKTILCGENLNFINHRLN